jgi:hypothetical protein
MVTKQEVLNKLKDVETGKIKNTDFLKWAEKNEADVLAACETKAQRLVVKNAIKIMRMAGLHKR